MRVIYKFQVSTDHGHVHIYLLYKQHIFWFLFTAPLYVNLITDPDLNKLCFHNTATYHDILMQILNHVCLIQYGMLQNWNLWNIYLRLLLGKVVLNSAVLPCHIFHHLSVRDCRLGILNLTDPTIFCAALLLDSSM